MKLPELKKSIKNKKVIAAIITAVSVGAVAGVVITSNRMDSLFDPSKYQETSDNQAGNVSVDSTVFGSQQSDNDGLEMDHNAQQDYDLNQGEDNQIKNDNQVSNNQLTLGIQGDSGTSTDSENVIGNDASSTITLPGGAGGTEGIPAPGDGAGGGGTGGNGSGGSGTELKPIVNPDRITAAENPEIEAGGTPEEVKGDTYVSMDIKDNPKPSPKVYAGQGKISIEEVKNCIQSITVTLLSGTTGKNYEVESPLDNLVFVTGDDSGTDMEVTLPEDGIVYVRWYRPGIANPAKAGESIQCEVYDYSLILQQPGGTAAYPRILSNEKKIDLTEKYSEILSEMKQDKTCVSDNNVMNKLFTGWYDNDSDKRYIRAFSFDKDIQQDEKSLKATAFEDVPDGFTVELTKDEGKYQQTLTGYQGSESTLEIPQGVTKVDVSSMEANYDVTTIRIPSSVQTIDFAALKAAFPNCQTYQTFGNEVDEVYHSDEDDKGILYKTTDGKLVLASIPVNYQSTEIDLSQKTGTMDIAKDVFAGCEGQAMTIKVSEKLLIENGWSFIPANYTIEIPYVENSNDMLYIRYLASLQQQNDDLILKVTDHEEIPGLYTYKDLCVYRNTSELAFVSSSVREVFTVPLQATTINKTAFEDATKITTLTISENVTTIEDKAFAGLTALSAVIVDKPSALVNVGKPFDSAAQYDSNLQVYLKETVTGDAAYQRWLQALQEIDAKNPSQHIQCAANGVYVDKTSGGIYYVNQGKYVLQSLPATTISYQVPAGMNLVGIDPDAFQGCEDLIYIELPDSVTTITSGTFSNCSQLEILNVPQQLEEVCRKDTSEIATMKLVAGRGSVYQDPQNWGVFYSKDKSTLLAVRSDYSNERLVLLSETTMIGEKACQNCTSITEVAATSGIITRIGEKAFAGCTSLSNLPVNPAGENLAGYETIDSQAFQSCTKLQAITIRGNQLQMGTEVFADCTGLMSVTFGKDNSPDSVQTTGINTFKGCSKVGRVDLYSVVTEIGEGTFRDCTALSNYVIGDESKNMFGTKDTLRKIGDYAFSNCVNLRIDGQFNLYHNLEEVGDYAFYNCKKLDFCSFPATTKSVGAYAFAQESASEDADQTSRFSRIQFVEDSPLENIGEGAFMNNGKAATVDLQEIENQSGVTIGDKAFLGCSNISTVNWGTDTIQNIGAQAFANCSDLPAFLPGTQQKLKSIGSSAFAGCSSLETVDVTGCPLLTEVSPGMFDYYTENAKARSTGDGCTSLTAVSLGSNIASIGARAFASAEKLESLELLSTSKVEIQTDAFYQKETVDGTLLFEKLAITVPETTDNKLMETYQADTAWKSALTGEKQEAETDYSQLDFTTRALGALRYYGGGTYQRKEDGTYILTSMSTSKKNGVALLANTSEIGEGAFRNCTQITAVHIPEKTTVIGKNAFEGCTSMEYLAFGGKQAVSIDTSLFGNTRVNENFQIYGIEEASDIYSRIDALNQYRMTFTGDFLQTDLVQGALYAGYSSISSYAYNGYVYQLMYVPRSYSGVMSLNGKTHFIYQEALRGCNITEFLVKSTRLRSIGDYALSDCHNLQHVDLYSYYLGSSLNHIGEGAFMNCTSLNAWEGGNTTAAGRVQIDRVSTMGKNVFMGCTSITAAIWTTKNLSHVPEGTFKNCTSLSHMTFGASLATDGYPVKSFGAECFAGCTGITTTGGSLASFGGLETIGERCYQGCNNMSLLILPASIKTVGRDALQGCTGLDILALNTESPISLRDAGISADTWSTMNVYVPTGYTQVYQEALLAQGIPSTGSVMDSGMRYRAISGNLYGCEDPTWAYYGASSNGVYHPGLIFAGTTETNAVTGKVSIYNSGTLRVTEIGVGALEDNQLIKQFVGRRTNGISYITEIRDNAFKNCKNLSDADFSSTNTSTELRIGNSAFEACSSLPNFVLRSKTTYIGSSAFAGTKAGDGTDANPGFILDATTMTDPAGCTLGTKIFGDEIPQGATITTNVSYTKLFLKTWGAQLQQEYELTEPELLALFPQATSDMLREIEAEQVNIE